MADETLDEAVEPEVEDDDDSQGPPNGADDAEGAMDDERGGERDEPAAAAGAVVPEGPQPPQTEAEMERRAKAWDRARDRHMTAAQTADEYRYSISAVCPLCDGHGLMYTPQTPEEAAQMRGFILGLVGEATPEEFHDHPKYHRCDTCDGYGKVRTGSRVAGQEALNCPDCNGQGHTGGALQGSVVPMPTPTVPATATVPADEQARIGNDAWGREPGHPHYGLLPALVK